MKKEEEKQLIKQQKEELIEAEKKAKALKLEQEKYERQ